MSVDLNDFIRKETTRHGKPTLLKLYRHSCNNCGVDRGYKAKSYNTPTCNKCAKMGLTVSNETKEKMSLSATKRYNDFTWQPKKIPVPFVGCRRPIYSYKQKTTPLQRKMKHRTKTLLWQKLINHSANKTGSTFDILGYTVDDLIKHLESQFQVGMTWETYGLGGWEIDHILPDANFSYSSTEDQGFKDSWALTNLQPMWYWDNRSKGASLCPRP